MSYPGAGSVGPFAFPFKVFDENDLLVMKRSSDGVETILAIGGQYTASGVGAASGTVTLTTALEVGETLFIRRKPALLQPMSIRNQGSYFPATIEDEVDRLVMQLQSLEDAVARSLKLKESLPGSAALVELEPQAGKVIVGTGTGFDLATLDAGAIAIPGAGRTVLTLTEYLLNNSKINALDYATPAGTIIHSGVNDAYTSLRVARAAQLALKLSGTGGVYGAGADVGTSPPLWFPRGVYKVTAFVTDDVNDTVRHARFEGDDAIIVASAGVRVFGGVGYGSKFAGLIFRQGACAISIKANASDSATVDVEHCEFHQQSTACIESDATSNAGIFRFSDCKFMQTIAGLGPILKLATADMATLQKCWIEGESVVMFDVVGVLHVEDCVGVPDGALAAPGGRWCDLKTTGSQIHFNRFRYGAESGGAPMVRCLADMDTSPDIEPTVISIKNSQTYAAGVYAVEFYKLPNVFEFTHNSGLVGCLGLYFDAGLTNADFRNFQEFGRVEIHSNYASAGMPIELDGNRTANGDLGMKVFTAMRAKDGDFPIPLRERLKVSDIKGSGDVSGGGFASVASVNTTDALVDDGYLVSRREITATADEASRSYNHTTFLDPAVLTYGRTYTLNLVVDVNAEFAVVTLSLCGATKRYPVSRGRHVLALPFVYLNNTGAPGVTFDTILETVDLRLSGDIVYLGRHILVEGIQRTKDVLVIEGTAAPAAYTDGIGPNVGYFRGDINYRTNVAAAGVPGDVCVTEGAPGTWKAMPAVAA